MGRWPCSRRVRSSVRMCPGVFYLLAGMPSAFHLLILARVYEVRALALMNRIVVGTTIPAVAAVVVVVGLAR